MSEDEIRRDLKKMTESGKLDPAIAKMAARYPVDVENLIRLGNIEDTQASHGAKLDKIDQAIFGDDDLQMKGLVHDVRSLKTTIFQAAAWIACGSTIGGLLLTIFGIWVEWNKH